MLPGKKVIFDTDIGIDDAMALLFLHRAHNAELAAIVTGFGNASLRDTTANALYLCERFDINVPVFRGAPKARAEACSTKYPDFVHGRNGLGDVNVPRSKMQVRREKGAEAIVSLARKYPQQISVVAVGRLTNLADALQLCPELPNLLTEVIVMAGAFGLNGHHGNMTPFAEANVGGDVTSAKLVLESDLPLVAVGLDVTQEIIASHDFFIELRNGAGPAGEFIYRVTRAYVEYYERSRQLIGCPIHDPSAVAYLLQPELFATERGFIRVNTSNEFLGQTTFAASERSTKKICTTVRADKVLQLISRTLCAPKVE